MKKRKCNCTNCCYKYFLTDDGSDTGEMVIWCGVSREYIGYIDEASKQCCPSYVPEIIEGK